MAYQEHLGRRFMDNFVMAHAVAHGVEQMMALGGLLTGACSKRFPTLKAAFFSRAAAAGCRWWLWSLDERVEKFGDDEPLPPVDAPERVLRRNCWVFGRPG